MRRNGLYRNMKIYETPVAILNVLLATYHSLGTEEKAFNGVVQMPEVLYSFRCSCALFEVAISSLGSLFLLPFGAIRWPSLRILTGRGWMKSLMLLFPKRAS